MMKYIIYVLCCLFPWFVFSCIENNEDWEMNTEVRQVSFQMQVLGVGSGSSLEGENDIHSLDAYLFQDGRLTRSITDLSVSSDGFYYASLTERNGNIYFLANTEQMIAEDVVTGMDENSFLSLTTLDAPGNIPFIMTGQCALADVQPKNTVLLKRGVARIDLDLRVSGIEVDSLVITNVAQRGYLFAGSSVETVANSTFKDLRKIYERPLNQADQGVFYLYEQQNNRMQAVVYIKVNGIKSVQTAVFPSEIKRNMIYQILISGNGGKLETSIKESDDWEEGNTTEGEMDPSKKIWIDEQLSVLPEGALLSQSRDTLFLPYQAHSATLVLGNVTPSADLVISGNATGVDIRQLSSHTLTVNAQMRLPQSKREYLFLDLKDPLDLQTIIGRVVIAVNPNGNVFTDFAGWNEQYACDYDKYLDGTLGYIKPAAGKKIELEFDAGESIWAKLVDDEAVTGQYRLVAGWKPNDPTANGRKQDVRIVISSFDGTNREVYTVSRRNWGLPVTEMNGIWWCKYNMRGDSRSFEDQVSIADDPAARKGQTVSEYLSSCSEDEYFSIWGDGYQGSNTHGLKLTYADSLFRYENFVNSVGQNMSALTHESHCPDGYQIPSVDDFKLIFRNGAGIFYDRLQTGYTSEKGNYSITGIPHKRENMTLNGGVMPEIYHYELKSGNESITIYGPGYQPDINNGIVPNYVIFATYTGSNNDNWLIEKKTTKGEYWHVWRDNRQTRVKMCIKKPVEYIYE